MNLLREIKEFIKMQIPDDIYLRWQFKRIMGYPLDLKNPKTFNEKLQWLKLYDRKPIYTTMVDKYEAKKYVASIIGEQYIIPTLGVWQHFDDIDFNKLPRQFVLKCTHDSGGLVIVRDKNDLDIKRTRRRINASLKRNFYYMGREWPYKNVKPRIIAEKYMSDGRQQDTGELSDYKLMCFDGKVRCTFTCTDRFTGKLKVTFFDNNWNVLPFERHYPKSDKPIAQPQNFEKMKVLAEQLAKDIPFVRVDFYNINGNLYFGELTFYPGCGFEEFAPKEADYKLGEWIKLPYTMGGYILKTDKYLLWIHPGNKSLDAPNKQYDTLVDYKFFCFNGYVDCVMLCVDRQSGNPKFYFFDKDWNLLRLNKRGKNAPNNFTLPKPEGIDQMFFIASKLSVGLKFARIDLYNCNGKIYFGEITFFPDCGFDKNLLQETEMRFGNLIDLQEVK